MFQILCAFAISLLLTSYACRKIIYICQCRNLYDEPLESRKVHKKGIPNLGGIAMYGSVVLSLLITELLFGQKFFPPVEILISSLVIFFVGITDDLTGMNPFKKLASQTFAAAIISIFSEKDFSVLFSGFGFIQPGWLILVISKTILLVVLINAFNLIDGIDLLAATTSLISMTIFSVFFFLAGELNLLVVTVSILAALLAFAMFNRSPARLFMGDAGSMQLGLISGIFVLEIISRLPSTPSLPEQVNLYNSFYLALAAMSFPLLDMTRVFMERIHQKQSPFSPDKRHLHHHLLKKKLTHHHSTALIVLFQIPVFLVAIWAPSELLPGVFVTLISAVLFYLAAFYLVVKKIPERKLLVKDVESNQPAKKKKQFSTGSELSAYRTKSNLILEHRMATTENELN